MGANTSFTFNISLSVLNHLGRNLYRSFGTVLGEAISNAWDADAQNVWIYLDPDKNGFWIKDDGIGMTSDDFQEKFLKIGYSKRKDGKSSSKKGRPFIGRKGIGKLALLSCAERISIISKTIRSEYIGGTIENPKLEEAITDDLTPQEYSLERLDEAAFAKYTKGHSQGTIIRFENLKDGVKHSFDFLSKTIALYFRFSLLDKTFQIFLDDVQITYGHLNDLAENTEFLWKVGNFNDPYVHALEKATTKDRGHEKKIIKEKKKIKVMKGVAGFIASVKKPRDLKIMTTEERVGVDLFVNGRLRERDILKHIPTARIAPSYLYGQIHFNNLDDKEDRFTSSREGIIANDPKYQTFLDKFRKTILKIVEDWDKWRLKNREEGDQESERISKTERASASLYNAVIAGYEPAKRSKAADKVDNWVNDLGDDAAFNFESYAECFISENLVRLYIKEKKIPLSPKAGEVADWKRREAESKKKGNISIEIRRGRSDLNYLDMTDLAHLVDKNMDKNKEAGLTRDADQFKPIRNALAHTALLTDDAKNKLKTVRDNIRARVKTLLSSSK